MRKGRALELLVAAIEKCFAPGEAELRSPDYIVDKITGSKREVDVSVRMHIGTIPVLAIIECRDRAEPADVTWVEQVAQKRNDVNAAKAMVVSASGFSEAARIKAAHLGIETRHLNDVSVDSLRGWFSGADLQVFKRRAQFLACSIGIDQGSVVGEMLHDEMKAVFDRPEFNDPLFTNKTTGTHVSMRDVWRTAEPSLAIWETIPRDGTGIQHEIELNFPNIEERMRIVLPSGSADVLQIVLTVAFWYDRETVPVSRAYTYGDSGGPITRGIQFPIEVADRKLTMEIHRVSNRVGITLTPVEDRDG